MERVIPEVNRGPRFKRRMIIASREPTPFAENVLIFLSYLLLLITFPIGIWACLVPVKVYQRLVIFRLGRLRGYKAHGPGLVFVLPCVDQPINVDVRTQSFDVTPQEILTRDSVTIQVDGVVYYNIQNPLNAVLQIEQARLSTKFLAQTTLRNVVGTKDLVELLAEKDSLSKTIEQILDDGTTPWGVKVERVEIKGIRGPGLVFILPCVDEFARVDLRTKCFDVHPQEVLTRDSVTIQVDAVVYYSIHNPLDSVIQVRNVDMATKLLAQTTLRNVLGTTNLMELLTAKSSLSRRIESLLDLATDPWGVKVERVEIKNVSLPATMQRAMAAEAEALREAKAKIVAADGELRASRALREASNIMSTNPLTLQLRYLQTLSTISSAQPTTILFPFPIDLTTLNAGVSPSMPRVLTAPTAPMPLTAPMESTSQQLATTLTAPMAPPYKQIHLPVRMQKVMAAEREAEREAQAKVISATGELAASRNLREASDVMISNPVALQLRYLQTLTTISGEKSHTIVFPFPMDLVKKTAGDVLNFDAKPKDEKPKDAEDGCEGGNTCSIETNRHTPCCHHVPKLNKKNQTKPEKKDVGIQTPQ